MESEPRQEDNKGYLLELKNALRSYVDRKIQEVIWRDFWEQWNEAFSAMDHDIEKKGKENE